MLDCRPRRITARQRLSRRIALVIYSLGPGGAERVVSMLAAAWAGAGDHVELITIAPPQRDFFQLDPAVRRQWLEGEDPGQRPRPRLLAGAARLRSLRKALRAARPDVILSFVEGVNNLTLLATAGLGVPVVVSERTDPRHHTLPAARRLARRALYPLADRLVVQTESVRAWAEGVVHPSRIAVVPNPLAPPRPREPGTETPRPEPQSRQHRIVGIGRLGWEKGFDLLIRAFAGVARRHPGWSLWIYGEGTERAALEHLAAVNGVAAAVHLPGLTADPAAILAQAGVFVLPSRFEGFPNALLEAMAQGAPVIAADCPSGPRHIIRHGVDGLLVPAGDADRLAGAISELINDPAQRAELGGRALEVRERFSLEKVLAEWDQLLDSVCAGRSR